MGEREKIGKGVYGGSEWISAASPSRVSVRSSIVSRPAARCLLKFKEPIAEDWWRGDIG